MPSPEDITRLLADLNAGKEGAEEALMPVLYEELRALARSCMRAERPGHTLQTTALVHEAYLRFGGGSDIAWQDRGHFMRIAARTMRRVLIDHARRKRTDRKGGKRKREPLDKAIDLMEASSSDLIAIDSVLGRLFEIDEQMGQVVELRFFGGLTIEETAKVLGISQTTVKQEWSLAKAWLKQELGS